MIHNPPPLILDPLARRYLEAVAIQSERAGMSPSRAMLESGASGPFKRGGAVSGTKIIRGVGRVDLEVWNRRNRTASWQRTRRGRA